MFQRAFRTIVLACLFLSQAQLLWLAGLHWYEHSYPPLPAPTAVDNGSRRGLPVHPSEAPCVVCQIVRQNAVRPGLAALAPRPITTAPWRPVELRDVHSVYHPLIAYGRAPPAV